MKTYLRFAHYWFCVVLCTEAVYNHKHTWMSSSYSSLDWVLSHWAHFTVHRFICVYLCYFSTLLRFFCQQRMCCIIVSTVGWTCSDWILILRTLIFLQCCDTVGWAIWPVKTRPRYDVQEAQLSQRDRAAACLNFDKNISANSVHLTLLSVRALTSTNHHFTVLRHHVCT